MQSYEKNRIISTNKKQNSELLKQHAKRQNCSFNNYVETLLFKAVYHQPNSETRTAMMKAESGKLHDAAALDLTSLETMEKSMDL